jgi:tape measure domain-containing protein
MAERTEALVLQMSADIRRMEKALNQARGITNRQLGQIENRFDKMNSNIKRSGDALARDLRATFASIGVGLAIREVTQYADAWTTAQNKLAAAGLEQGKVAATMRDLVTLAQATRSSFEGTVDLYAKLTRAGQQLNLTQEQVRKITETTLQAFVAGGAAASEQAAAITQLSQALGSGVLQGDELRSIRENAPLLAQAIADEFKTTIAGLKELGAEGELTADRVARAILNADGIYDAFSRTVTTLGQAMENLRTEFTRYIAESRIAQGAVQVLAGFIELVTNNIDLLADAAIVAAAAIGGTLAVQAMGRFVASLRVARLEAARAGTQFIALRTAMSFLGGPVGAILLGIGAALGSMALGAMETKDAMEEANSAVSNLGKAQADIKADTDALTEAQERLTRAIDAGATAAQSAAITEVEAIRRRIAANQELARTERIRLNEAKFAREREFRAPLRLTDADREGINLPILGLLGEQTEPLEELVRRMQQTFASSGMDSSLEGIRSEIGRRSAQGPLNEQFRTFFFILQRWDQYQADMAAIINAISSIDQMQTGAGDQALAFPGLPDSGKATQSLAGYRTEVERLGEAMRALRESAAGSDRLFSDMVLAFDSLQAVTDQNDPNAVSELERRRVQLGEFFELFDEGKLTRSREALQALLSFADTAGIAAAFDKLPSLTDVLLPDDVALFRTEASKRVKAAADELATGYRGLEVERDNTLADINAAMADAIAAGVTNLNVYLDAIEAAHVRFREDVAQLWRDSSTLDLATPTLDGAGGSQLDGLDAIWEDLQQKWISEGIIPSEAMIAFREQMRDSVKNAVREGIRTGDWGDSFASILADAVTTGLDSALNRVGDWLADFLFSQDGLFNSIVSGTGNWLASSFGGGRAAGGPVSAGMTYLVGERGPELLRMNGANGNIINASQTNKMLSGAGGGGTVIDAGVTIMGSVDAVSWPRLQAALAQQRQVIMSAVPGAVQATLTFNRMQKKRI